MRLLRNRGAWGWIGALGCALILGGCSKKPIQDEAKLAGLTTADFPHVDADVFKPMDSGLVLNQEEIRGRNAWNLWTAGNQHFWNKVAQDSYGLMDLLKTLDNRKYKRGERFKTLGLVNQPGFKAAEKPDEFGLWLDEPVDPANPEPAGIDTKVYGKPTGVLGFRLFPNPEFDDKARAKWDGNRWMSDPAYYNDNKLVRPYRVGVSCGSCHIAPHPNFPPADPENPRWENLASAIGNQYFREGPVFASNVEKGGFFYEMIRAQPPGTSDTSRIATDHINNPNAINAIFLLDERARIQVPEKLAGGTLALPGTKAEMPVAHILKDGADSIGIPGATIRVYVNIGMFSEYWLSRHNRLLGLRPQQAFEIPYARENSVFWLATEERLKPIAAFFEKIKPYRLEDTPAGAAFVAPDPAVLTRGRQVFGQSCASCHSSKQPEGVQAQSPEAREWFRKQVDDPKFWEDNFLSSEARIPVSDRHLQTNSARAVATNAMAGHIWDNFSSQTYKELTPAGELELYNPFDEAKPIRFRPGDKTGPGYYRVPSLVSIWSSAPFFHNNALGLYNGDPSFAGRLAAFNDAAEKLLWPEKRLGKASIWRTENECHLHLAKEFVPKPLQGLADAAGYVKIGPIPKGTPINLIANLDPDLKDLLVLTGKLGKAFLAIKTQNLDSEAAAQELLKSVPELLAANKNPDFITDKGHYYGTDLPDEDKRALIEFLKTL